METQRTASEAPLSGGNFRLFVTRLSFQAMISLGMLENPLTKTRQRNLDNARMLIDDLSMLQEKTAGSLDDDEATYLDKVIGDLQHAFATFADAT